MSYGLRCGFTSKRNGNFNSKWQEGFSEWLTIHVQSKVWVSWAQMRCQFVFLMGATECKSFAFVPQPCVGVTFAGGADCSNMSPEGGPRWTFRSFYSLSDTTTSNTSLSDACHDPVTSATQYSRQLMRQQAKSPLCQLCSSCHMLTLSVFAWHKIGKKSWVEKDIKQEGGGSKKEGMRLTKSHKICADGETKRWRNVEKPEKGNLINKEIKAMRQNNVRKTVPWIILLFLSLTEASQNIYGQLFLSSRWAPRNVEKHIPYLHASRFKCLVAVTQQSEYPVCSVLRTRS